MGWDDVDDVPDDERVAEWKLRAVAIPAALTIAALFHLWSTGRFLQRTFFAMQLHELGHAVTAWWSGVRAIPVLWKTMIAPERSAFVGLLVATFNGYLIVRGGLQRRYLMVAIGAALLVLQLVASFATSGEHAQMWIIFGGDGGAMVLGTVLMACFFVGPDSPLHRGGVRWGLLVIGAASFVDTFAMWWSARRDPDVIPFGEIEGVGQSDPSKLTEVFGWSQQRLIHSYVTLGVTCLVVLVAVWAWSVWLARRLDVVAGRVEHDAK